VLKVFGSTGHRSSVVATSCALTAIISVASGTVASAATNRPSRDGSTALSAATNRPSHEGSASLSTEATSPSHEGSGGQSIATTRAHTKDSAVRTGVYLVLLSGQPTASYDGHLQGYRATRPARNARFDSSRPAVAHYAALLVRHQRAVLSRIGDPPSLYRYTTALNGFAARLSLQQVKQLQADPRVFSVQPNTKVHLDATPNALTSTLAAPTGPRGGPNDGSGIVIADIDSGIWPENPSFASLARRIGAHGLWVPGFTGTCQPGEAFTITDCNDKVIAARWFIKGFGAQNIAEAEYASPRDGSGHGSHTAATAAGDYGVAVTIDDQAMGQVSGLAPAAYLSIYKACWTAPNPDQDGCTTADTVKAIDQAVRDGSDVISYSISGTRTNFRDPVEIAFLNAAAAGVFVATSAGNGGPRASSLAHPSPWATSVGATITHVYQGAVVLGDGRRFVGAMISDHQVRPTQIVYAGGVAAPGAAVGDARLCNFNSLDASAVAGNIVVCDRGVIARVDKSAAVTQAGGVAMVLVNTAPNSLDADFHSVPTVHLDEAAGEAVKRYIEGAGAGATAALDPTGHATQHLPMVAGFSSRGPLLAARGNIAKPDLVAPGVSVVGAVAPSSNAGRLWDLYSGTSMSAAYVAGLAAATLARHPGWTPTAVKSALMTTATGVPGAPSPFAQGAGQPDVAAARDPGLVYDSDISDWLGFLARQRVRHLGGVRPPLRPIAASNLNAASIAVGDLVGRETVRRTVTNVGSRSETYAARVTGLPGIEVRVRPWVLTLKPGHSADFTVRLQVQADVAYGQYATGSLVWRGSLGHRVRSAIVARPERLRAATQASGTGAAGAASVTGRAGFIGGLAPEVTGLVGALPQQLTLAPEPLDTRQPAAGPGTAVMSYDVEPGTAAVRFEASTTRSGDDVDLFVYRDRVRVAQAESAKPDPRITLANPVSGHYDVYVNGFAAANGRSLTTTYTGWVLSPGDRHNLSISPKPVAANLAQPFTYSARWTGLDRSKRWFGAVTYPGSDRRTYVSVN
jgi:Subtilase family/Fibronectin type-III domain/PA domain/Peptidase inhibitor I9